jgi:hypothetical protein
MQAMKPITVIAPTGCVGCGWGEEAFRRGMSLKPDAIAVDAGSSDSGPYYLGTGKTLFPRSVLKRQIREILLARNTAKIPLIIGSAGTAGARPHVDTFVEIVREIAKEESQHFKLSWIYSDIPHDRVKRAIKARNIIDFEAGFELTEELVDSSVGLVGQMGYEPIVKALADGAEVIVAGRACDDHAIAAYPIFRGGDPALSIHMGKILECGAFASEPFAMDVMLGTLNEDHFILEPGSLRRRATVKAVASHSLYEREDPFDISGPGGTVDLRSCEYREIDRRRVSVCKSKLIPTEKYYVKIEGARQVGYRSSVIVGVRCPTMIKEMDWVLAELKKHAMKNYADDGVALRFLVFGRDAVMGELEPMRRHLPHEVGVLIDTVGPTQDLAHEACNFVALEMQHIVYPGQLNNAANVAFPHSPREMNAGPVFSWSAYHLMLVDSANELFTINTELV